MPNAKPCSRELDSVCSRPPSPTAQGFGARRAASRPPSQAELCLQWVRSKSHRPLSGNLRQWGDDACGGCEAHRLDPAPDLAHPAKSTLGTSALTSRDLSSEDVAGPPTSHLRDQRYRPAGRSLGKGLSSKILWGETRRALLEA